MSLPLNKPGAELLVDLINHTNQTNFDYGSFVFGTPAVAEGPTYNSEITITDTAIETLTTPFTMRYRRLDLATLFIDAHLDFVYADLNLVTAEDILTRLYQRYSVLLEPDDMVVTITPNDIVDGNAVQHVEITALPHSLTFIGQVALTIRSAGDEEPIDPEEPIEGDLSAIPHFIMSAMGGISEVDEHGHPTLTVIASDPGYSFSVIRTGAAPTQENPYGTALHRESVVKQEFYRSPLNNLQSGGVIIDDTNPLTRLKVSLELTIPNDEGWGVGWYFGGVNGSDSVLLGIGGEDSLPSGVTNYVIDVQDIPNLPEYFDATILFGRSDAVKEFVELDNVGYIAIGFDSNKERIEATYENDIWTFSDGSEISYDSASNYHELTVGSALRRLVIDTVDATNFDEYSLKLINSILLVSEDSDPIVASTGGHYTSIMPAEKTEYFVSGADQSGSSQIDYDKRVLAITLDETLTPVPAGSSIRFKVKMPQWQGFDFTEPLSEATVKVTDYQYGGWVYDSENAQPIQYNDFGRSLLMNLPYPTAPYNAYSVWVTQDHVTNKYGITHCAAETIDGTEIHITIDSFLNGAVSFTVDLPEDVNLIGDEPLYWNPSTTILLVATDRGIYCIKSRHFPGSSSQVDSELEFFELPVEFTPLEYRVNVCGQPTFLTYRGMLSDTLTFLSLNIPLHGEYLSEFKTLNLQYASIPEYDDWFLLSDSAVVFYHRENHNGVAHRRDHNDPQEPVLELPTEVVGVAIGMRTVRMRHAGLTAPTSIVLTPSSGGAYFTTPSQYPADDVEGVSWSEKVWSGVDWTLRPIYNSAGLNIPVSNGGIAEAYTYRDGVEAMASISCTDHLGRAIVDAGDIVPSSVRIMQTDYNNSPTFSYLTTGNHIGRIDIKMGF